MVTQNELILDISKAMSGSVHDFNIFKERLINTRLMQLLNLMGTVIVWADSAYEALDKYLPNWQFLVNEKGKRNHPLTEEQKQNNKHKSRTRILVEHVISRVKKYRACSERVRNLTPEKQSRYWNIAAGICNLRRVTILGISEIFEYHQ